MENVKRKACTSFAEFSEQNAATGAGLPYSRDISCLGDSVDIGGKTARNRLVCQAMEGCDGNPDGTPGELTERRYLRLAEGGAGIIWFEATACLREGRANPRQLWLYKDNIGAFASLVDKIRETGMKANGYAPLVIMQDTHSGRYSKPDGRPAPIIAYNNPILEKDGRLPEECIATDDYLDRVGEALVNNAVLAEKAGFDGVDIKCCHRYLNSELLSAYNREGRYGGAFENRTRLLCESISGAAAGTSEDFIVTSRLNAYDGFEYPNGFGVKKDGGTDFDPTEPVMLIKRLYSLGVRVLDITMGNPYFNPHVNRPFAAGPYEPPEHPMTGVARMLEGTAELKRSVPEMKIVSSGLTYPGVAAPNVAAAYISDGKFDFAGFGRMILAYPEFARDILEGGGLDPKRICICCSKCTELMRSGSTPGCVVRDGLYAALYREMKKQN